MQSAAPFPPVGAVSESGLMETRDLLLASPHLLHFVPMDAVTGFFLVSHIQRLLIIHGPMLDMVSLVR